MAKKKFDGVYDADPETDPEAKLIEQHHAPGGPGARPTGHGLDGLVTLHGQRSSHRGLQHERSGEHRARASRRTDGYESHESNKNEREEA